MSFIQKDSTRKRALSFNCIYLHTRCRNFYRVDKYGIRLETNIVK